MTPDQAREIAIRWLRGQEHGNDDELLEAAAVLEALGSANTCVLCGGTGKHRELTQAEKDYAITLTPTRPGEPQANVEEKKAAGLTGPERNAIEALLNGMTQRHHRDILRALVEASRESAT